MSRTSTTPRGAAAVKDRPATPQDGAPVSLSDTPVLGQYNIHPAANIFPMMSQEGLRQMAEDIREHGLQEPVWMHQGQVLDGRNRLVACDLAGVAPKFTQWVPRNSDDTPYAFVWSKNGPRRHLTTSQRATLAVRMAEQIREEHDRLRSEHRAAQAAARAAQSPFSDAGSAVDNPVGVSLTPGTQLQFTGGVGGDQPVKQSGRPGSPFGVPAGTPKFGKSREQAAAAMNVSVGYVNDARDLRKAAPQEFEAVERGDMSLAEAQVKVVTEARESGRLGEVKLRDGVMKRVLEGLDSKAAKNAPKPRIRLRKFGQVASSRTTVVITMTGGNPAVIEDWLNRMQDDPKVISMEYEVVEEKPDRRRGK